MTVDAALVMVLGLARGGHSLRLPLTKRITTIGSDAAADVVLPTAPAHWAVVHRADGAAEVLIASTNRRHRLAPGDGLEADGIRIALESAASARDRERAIEELGDREAAAKALEIGVRTLYRYLA